jgi:hypothetical protein
MDEQTVVPEEESKGIQDECDNETFQPKPPPYPPPTASTTTAQKAESDNQTATHEGTFMETVVLSADNAISATVPEEESASSVVPQPAVVPEASPRKQEEAVEIHEGTLMETVVLSAESATVPEEESASVVPQPAVPEASPRKPEEAITIQPAATEGGNDAQVDEQDVLDALLVAARDSSVSASAGLALAKLAVGKGAGKLVARATSLLTDHSRAVTEHAIKESLPHRVSLYKIVASILKENASNNSHSQQQQQQAPQSHASGVDHSLAAKFAELAVSDLTAINIAMMAAASGVPMGTEWELQRNASRTLVVLANAHSDVVMTHLLPKLELASMFHQQQAQKRAAQMRGGLQEAQELVLVLVLITLKDIATSFPEQLTRHFKAALGRLLPVMGMAVSSQVKEAWSSCITACCTAVRQQALEVRCASGRVGEEGWKEGSLRVRVRASSCVCVRSRMAVYAYARLCMCALLCNSRVRFVVWFVQAACKRLSHACMPSDLHPVKCIHVVLCI